MCLTIPKRVVSVSGDEFLLENACSGEREQKRVRSIIDVKKNDIVLTQGGIIIEKINESQLKEINNILKTYKKNE